MEAYRDTAQRCLARMEYLYDALTSRMDCPLIRQCSRYAGRFVLHRSNLFRMHRDYHCVYSLLCFCAENGIGTETVSGDAAGCRRRAILPSARRSRCLPPDISALHRSAGAGNPLF